MADTKQAVPGLDQIEAVVGRLGKLGAIIAGWTAAITAAIGTGLNRDGREVVGETFGLIGDAWRRLWGYASGQFHNLSEELATIYAMKWGVFPLACIGYVTFIGDFTWRQWLPIFGMFLVITWWQAALFVRYIGFGAVMGFLYGMMKGFRNPRSIGDAFQVVNEMLHAGPAEAREILSRSVVRVWAEHSWWVIVTIYAMMAPYQFLPKGMMLFPGLFAFYLVLANNPVPWQNRNADGQLVRNAENKPAMPGAHKQLVAVSIALLLVFPVVAWMRYDPTPHEKTATVSIWDATFHDGRAVTLPGASIEASDLAARNAAADRRWSYAKQGAAFYVTVELIAIALLIWIARRPNPTRVGFAGATSALGYFVLAPGLSWFWLFAPLAALAFIPPRR